MKRNKQYSVIGVVALICIIFVAVIAIMRKGKDK